MTFMNMNLQSIKLKIWDVLLTKYLKMVLITQHILAIMLFIFIMITIILLKQNKNCITIQKLSRKLFLLILFMYWFIMKKIIPK